MRAWRGHVNVTEVIHHGQSLRIEGRFSEWSLSTRAHMPACVGPAINTNS
jgi:hypothetical protein